jgi:serine protease inhibitor
MQRVHKPEIGAAALMFLLAAPVLVVACEARAPSAQERSAATPARQQDDVPAGGTPTASPAGDSQDGDSRVLAERAPEDDAFHRELTVPARARPALTMSANAPPDAVRRNNVVSFALWKAFAEHDNFVVSPYSIRAALTVVYLASGGKSRERLQSLLSYPERAEDLAIGALDVAARAGSVARLDSASSLWIADAKSLQRPYLQRVADFARTEVHAIDFSTEPERARRIMNSWMATHSREYMVEPLPESTMTSRSQAVLVDTISFAGTWPPKFMLAEGLHAWTDQDMTVGRVTMDMAYGGKCRAVFNDSATASIGDCTGSACREAVDAAIADYRDSSLSLMVVKPESWKQFIWSESSFSRIWAALRKAPEVDFHFPIIKLRSTRDLEQPLLRLGLSASDLSLSHGAVERAVPKLLLDRMVHQASFHADAESPKREPTPSERDGHGHDYWIDDQPPQYFTTDYAFYFLVVERATGLIVLMGQVVEPPSYESNRDRDEHAPMVPGASRL